MPKPEGGPPQTTPSTKAVAETSCVVPGAVNQLHSRKCRKLLQSSNRVVCVELFESSFGVVLESKLLKVGKCTFNSKTSLKQV